jgi:endonuclease-8
MPEGDTIFRAARALNRALAGRIVTRFESVFPALTRVDEDHPLAGRTIESVGSRGKHLLMTFSGDLVLHTHLRMNGSWHLYRPGQRWHRPRRDMRIQIATEEVVAVGFNIPVAEFLDEQALGRHRDLRSIGPDPLAGDFDADAVRAGMRARGSRAIGDVLLDQRVIAGIGNVLKSEVLFLAAADPFTPVHALSEAALARVVAVAREQLAANVLEREHTLIAGAGRRTTRSMNPHEKLWVYGRGGRPCRRCGTPIAWRRTGVDARITFWCPQCQVAAGHD